MVVIHIALSLHYAHVLYTLAEPDVLCGCAHELMGWLRARVGYLHCQYPAWSGA